MHWIRLNEQPTLRASARASMVLATPGTSSSSTCPPQNHETSDRTICRRLPTMTFSTLAMIFLAVAGTSLMPPMYYDLPRLSSSCSRDRRAGQRDMKGATTKISTATRGTAPPSPGRKSGQSPCSSRPDTRRARDHRHPTPAAARIVHALDDQFANHPHQPRMIAHGCGPHHVDAQLVAKPADLHVEVVDHFHVLRQEADRHDHEVGQAPAACATGGCGRGCRAPATAGWAARCGSGRRGRCGTSSR